MPLPFKSLSCRALRALSSARVLLLGASLLLLLLPAQAAEWRAIGPDGGNARALALDPSNPDHILLGAGGGALFESNDGGRQWHRLAQLGVGEELMLETLAFDPANPSTIFAAGWSLSGSGGGFFVSYDGGRSWSEPAELYGKSIQALAIAPSDPSTLVAGALDGLYRSADRGQSWERITPAGHADLKNFESVAIDPRDSRIIYAGTWHLPWKTMDGGRSWQSIRQGVIDDSDVFSIILDRGNPAVVYASACSGIYKSEDAGRLFHKIQGIPGSARRTRVLAQDPNDAATVYAGTTEGLWKTTDGGRSFRLITPPEFILNDVVVDPRDSRRVMIATDRGGIFVSGDGGASFAPSNQGFAERRITAIAGRSASDLYAAVVNDKSFGGVVHYDGQGWSSHNAGLETQDVLDLALTSSGNLLAATGHGLFRRAAGEGTWQPAREVVNQRPAPLQRPQKDASGHWYAPKLPPIVERTEFAGRVSALAQSARRWLAATANGVLWSDDEGATWHGGGPIDGEGNILSAAARERLVLAASARRLWISRDEGEHWLASPLPSWVARIDAVAIGEDGSLWVAGREGALRLSPGAKAWEHVLGGLPASEVNSLRAEGNLLVATSRLSSTVFVSRDHGSSWQAEPGTGSNLSGARLLGTKLGAISLHRGILLLEGEENAASSR